MAETEDIIEFDRPTRGSKDGYLQLFFISRQQLGRIIADPEQVSGDKRIIYYTKFLISSITDDTIRNDVRIKYNTELDKIKQERLDNEIAYEKVIDITNEVLGDITAFYDEFLGISHRLKVGLV